MTPTQKIDMMDTVRHETEEKLYQIRDRIHAEGAIERNYILLTDYICLTRHEEGRTIWTDAIQQALTENLFIQFPASDEPYWIDETILLDSGHRITAYGAVIQQKPGSCVCIMRNRNVVYGGDSMDDSAGIIPPDKNIAITGGTWIGEGGSRTDGCLFDRENSMPGVSAAFLFSNIHKLYLSDMKVGNTGGFAFQIGNIREFLIENIVFEHAHADGIHLSGLTHNGVISNIKGDTGDDLIALNMWDWPNSSINYGDMDNILVENIESTGGHRALRILPGRKFYINGTERDCNANRIILRNIKGIHEFKLYMQPYPWKDKPMRTEVGHGDMIWIDGVEDIRTIEVCSNIEHMSVENIIYDCGSFIKNNEMSASSVIEGNRAALVRIGPKSETGNISGPSEFWEEIYLPDACAYIDTIRFRNILDNAGRLIKDNNLVFAITMHPNSDYPRTTPRGGVGNGYVNNIIIE